MRLKTYHHSMRWQCGSVPFRSPVYLVKAPARYRISTHKTRLYKQKICI